MTRTGLDRLLADPSRLARPALRPARPRRLAHRATCGPSIARWRRARPGRPRRSFGPEHGFYGIEQDMVGAAGGRDPWTGAPIVSLYGDTEETLRPCPCAFTGLDLLVIDLQDVGSRYYTYAATAVWAAEAALAAGCEVWVLDRPNPIGGEVVEGNLLQPGYESFVGAFRLPVRHGLTLGELVRLEARRRGWGDGWEIWPMEGWTRSHALGGDRPPLDRPVAQHADAPRPPSSIRAAAWWRRPSCPRGGARRAPSSSPARRASIRWPWPTS